VNLQVISLVLQDSGMLSQHNQDLTRSAPDSYITSNAKNFFEVKKMT